MEPALGILAQQDPQRFDRAMGALQRVGQIQGAQTQWQQQQAQFKHQQFEATVVAGDARLTEMFGGDKAAADAANNATISAEHGIHGTRCSRFSRPIRCCQRRKRVGPFGKAAEYRKIKSAPKAIPKSLPAVQRPGVQQDTPRTGDKSSKIQALQKQLATAKGDKADRIAGQIKP
jgi:hypothetical protein